MVKELRAITLIITGVILLIELFGFGEARRAKSCSQEHSLRLTRLSCNQERTHISIDQVETGYANGDCRKILCPLVLPSSHPYYKNVTDTCNFNTSCIIDIHVLRNGFANTFTSCRTGGGIRNYVVITYSCAAVTTTTTTTTTTVEPTIIPRRWFEFTSILPPLTTPLFLPAIVTRIIPLASITERFRTLRTDVSRIPSTEQPNLTQETDNFSRKSSTEENESARQIQATQVNSETLPSTTERPVSSRPSYSNTNITNVSALILPQNQTNPSNVSNLQTEAPDHKPNTRTSGLSSVSPTQNQTTSSSFNMSGESTELPATAKMNGTGFDSTVTEIPSDIVAPQSYTTNSRGSLLPKGDVNTEASNQNGGKNQMTIKKMIKIIVPPMSVLVVVIILLVVALVVVKRRRKKQMNKLTIISEEPNEADVNYSMASSTYDTIGDGISYSGIGDDVYYSEPGLVTSDYGSDLSTSRTQAMTGKCNISADREIPPEAGLPEADQHYETVSTDVDYDDPDYDHTSTADDVYAKIEKDTAKEGEPVLIVNTLYELTDLVPPALPVTDNVTSDRTEIDQTLLIENDLYNTWS